MPLFEYECRDCEGRFEELVSNGAQRIACSRCGSKAVTKLLSSFAVGGSSSERPAEPGPCGACGAAVRGSCAVD